MCWAADQKQEVQDLPGGPRCPGRGRQDCVALLCSTGANQAPSNYKLYRLFLGDVTRSGSIAFLQGRHQDTGALYHLCSGTAVSPDGCFICLVRSMSSGQQASVDIRALEAGRQLVTRPLTTLLLVVTWSADSSCVLLSEWSGRHFVLLDLAQASE